MLNPLVAFDPVRSQAIQAALELQQLAYTFQREVDDRHRFETYCQWYYSTAEQNQADLAAMQKDIPFLDWFLSRRR